jgi:hypothetical protein
MKSKLLISTAAFAVAAFLGPASAGSLSDSHAKTFQLAQEKGGTTGGGMSGGANAAPESKGGEKTQPHKGAPEKGAAEKGGMEKRGAEKTEKGEKAEHREKRDSKASDMKKEEKSTEKKGDRDREKMTRDRDKGDQKTSDKGANDKSSDRAANSKGDAKNVHLDQKQETRIKTVIKEKNVTHLKRADIHFSINVGTRVPASVHWYPLPVEIVEIVPEYRGYYYIIVDEEIIIIAPNTREIVTVIRIA